MKWDFSMRLCLLMLNLNVTCVTDVVFSVFAQLSRMQCMLFSAEPVYIHNFYAHVFWS
uniref:Uncharacterized protein n=1 Tax=Rhizophora mucronata TaxID=61149 RepID=A0A2P2QDM2_RHIMU